MQPTPERPRFPLSALNAWLAFCCAIVALITVWVLPISRPSQLGITALFVAVPVAFVIFWLGRRVEHRAQDSAKIRPSSTPD